MATRFLHAFLIIFVVCSREHLLIKAETCNEFVETTTCGGNVIGDSGIIRYNHSEYGDNSGCMWLIRSNINSEIEVRLLEDTFSSSSQYIGIYQLFLDGEIGGTSGSYIRHGDFAVRQFKGPVILIKFSTVNYYATGNDSNSVPSFTLLFRGCGPDIVNPPTLSHFFREKIPGETEVISYPEDGGIYPNNQLITYLGMRKDRAIIRNSEGEWKVKVMFHDIQPSSYCLFADSLKFYSGGFNMLCAVDEQNEFIWRFCQRNSNETHILPKRSPKYGNTFPDNIGILAVFSSNGSQGGKGFVFEW